MFAFDGNVVDMFAVAGGVIMPLLNAGKITWRKSAEHLTRDKFIIDMLNGVMIAPFAMMVLSVFSSEMMKLLTEASKLTIAIGGLAGLFFVFAELFKE